MTEAETRTMAMQIARLIIKVQLKGQGVKINNVAAKSITKAARVLANEPLIISYVKRKYG